MLSAGWSGGSGGCVSSFRGSSLVPTMMFKRKLTALDYMNPDNFNVAGEMNEYKALRGVIEAYHNPPTVTFARCQHV